MGLFGKLLGTESKDYPELDSASPAAQNLRRVQAQLEQLAAEVKDPLEVVPAEQAAYVIIGKPPRKFGIAWIQDGKINNFKTLVNERGLSPITLEKLSDKLKESYISHQDDERFSTSIGGRKIVVTPSERFVADIREIIKTYAG